MLTIAATSGGALTGGLLLFVYALGMAVPLFMLALMWERVGPWARSHVSAGEWRIGRWSRPRVTVISSLMFIVLGFAFIVFQGSNAFSGFYEDFGASDFSASLEAAFNDIIRSQGDLAAISTLAVVIGVATILGIRYWRGRSNGPGDGDSPDDLDDLDDDYELDEPATSAGSLR